MKKMKERKTGTGDIRDFNACRTAADDHDM